MREPSPRGWRRVFHLSTARRVPQDVDAELRFHLEERIEELMAEGMTRPEAIALAERKFGDVASVRREVESIDRESHRRRARGEWRATLARDARVAVRTLRRSPGFAVAALLTLALAIGANTAIFSAVNAVLLHPIPTGALDRLVVVRSDLPALELRDTELSPSESEDLFRRTDLFSAATAYLRRRPTLLGMGEPRQLGATRTLGRFFDVFEVRPLLGRVYRPDESEDGHHRVVVLSYGTWQELYGGDLGIVGRTMDLGGASHEIIGVLPRGFRHPQGTDVYQPFPMDSSMRTPEARSRLIMSFVGRMRDDVTLDGLRTALDVEVRRWTAGSATASTSSRSHLLVATPFVEHLAGRLRPVLRILMAAVVLILLIACANVASLQMVRSAGRAREIAVRVALGARRTAVVRQLVVESLVLALAGGALGLLLGQLVVTTLARVAPAQFPQLEGLVLDRWVLGFTMAIAVGAGLAFGLLPALPASRVDVNDALKEGAGRGATGSASRARLLQGSVVLQVAMTLMLLLGSALVFRSFAALLALDPGFRPDHVVTMRVTPPGAKYPPTGIPAFYAQLLERVRALPGVEAAGAVFGLPFTDQDSSPFSIPGADASPVGAPPRHAEYRVVTGDYFRAMGIPIVRGRAFAPADGERGPNVVVVDEQLAKQYFPGQDPVGRQLKHLGSARGDTWTIVGVVGSVMRAEIGEQHKATVYYHHPQIPWYSTLVLTVRTSQDAPAVTAALRSVIRRQDPDVLLTDIRTMRERVDQSLGARRLAVFVLGGFAALALVLALLGIYGVVSYGMTQRRQEFGIRMALGATARDVTRMVLRQGALLAAGGVAIGVLAFLLVGGALDALLYGIAARDPLTIVLGMLVVATVALLASWLPARRAASVEPVAALRAQ